MFLGTIFGIAVLGQSVLSLCRLAPIYLSKMHLASGELSVVLPCMGLQHDLFRVKWRHGHWAETTIQQIAERMAECELQ